MVASLCGRINSSNETSYILEVLDMALDFTLKRRAIEQAFAQVRTGKAALYRPDGTPKFAPAELNEQMAALLQPLQAAAAEAQAVAADAEQEANMLELMRNADPIAALPAADLERAGALRPFVVDFCENEPLSILSERLSAVVAHGTPAEKALYARYAQRRHDATLETVQSERLRLKPGEGNALSAIGTAAEALRVASTPLATADALAKAVTLRQQAHELRSYARDTLEQVDGSRDRQQADTTAFYRMAF